MQLYDPYDFSTVWIKLSTLQTTFEGMRWVKSIVDFYVRSSLHVSICYLCFFIAIGGINNYEPTINIMLFVTVSTLVGYNFAKYIHFYRSNFRFKSGIIIVSMLSILIATTLVFKMWMWTLVLFSLCGLLTLFYTLPLLLGHSMIFIVGS